MKIGILTYHRRQKCGALLQAIALRKYLEDNGHEAYFIDYWPKYHSRKFSSFPSLYDKNPTTQGRIMGLIRDLCLYPKRAKRIEKFSEFIERKIRPYCIPPSEKFDCVICGSDQIWKKQEGLGGIYDPVYFGGGDIKSRTYIAYAGSMGEVNIGKDDEHQLRELFRNFRIVSAREDKLVDALQSHEIAKDVALVADPAILFGHDGWRYYTGTTTSFADGPYALYYRQTDGTFNERAIRKYAKSNGLKLIVLEGEIGIKDYFRKSITDADPSDMQRLIAHADFVFTSSYHGLIFSLLFQRQVVCAFHGKADRARSLLTLLGIPERLVDKDTPFPTAPIDYKEVGPKLEELATFSREWLAHNLGMAAPMK